MHIDYYMYINYGLYYSHASPVVFNCLGINVWKVIQILHSILFGILKISCEHSLVYMAALFWMTFAIKPVCDFVSYVEYH